MLPLKYNAMNTLTETFGQLYKPHSALLIYRKDKAQSVYVEAYDIGKNGNPINAHPLSIRESIALAQALDTSSELSRGYLRPNGLLPKNVLYINPDSNGFVLWQTPPQNTGLFFKGLTIDDGTYPLPSLLWKASKDSLSVYALKGDGMPSLETPLYQAPFFNLYEDGRVCMGTVNIQAKEQGCLEYFIKAWQQYFFNSKFSHLIGSSPIKGNIVQLYQSLAGGRNKFPQNVLIKNGLTLKDIIR